MKAIARILICLALILWIQFYAFPTKPKKVPQKKDVAVENFQDDDMESIYIGDQPIGEAFDSTIDSMEKMDKSLKENDVNEAIAHFNDAHDFFHNIDLMLRERNQDLAQTLWDTVLFIELEIEKGDKANPKEMKKDAKIAIDGLKKAKVLFHKNE